MKQKNILRVNQRQCKMKPSFEKALAQNGRADRTAVFLAVKRKRFLKASLK
ncbi:hypothetical protein EH5_02664 [Bacillus subtilis]|nr:hypothetical protein EH5_02664 [Bacillus subtilis]